MVNGPQMLHIQTPDKGQFLPIPDICHNLQENIPVNLHTKLKESIEQIVKDLHRSATCSCPCENRDDLSYVKRAYQRKIREIAVFNLRCFKAFFTSESNVLVGAVFMLDCFLQKVKVQAKYMSCVTAACFRLASMAHGTGVCPSAEEMSGVNKHAWSAGDLKRMEHKVAEKVGMSGQGHVTSVTFLRTFHELVSLADPQVLTACPWERLTMSMEACLFSHTYSLFRPCTMALSLLDVVLQDLCESPKASEVVRVVFMLQSLCQISDAELYECNESVVKMLLKYREGKLARDCLVRGKRRVRPLRCRSDLTSIPEEGPSPVGCVIQSSLPAVPVEC